MLRLIEYLRGQIIYTKRWLSYRKVCKKINDLDFDSILEVEKHQITRLRGHIKKYGNSTNVDWKISRMSIAISLLDIMLNRDPTLYDHHSDKWKCKVYVNTKNAARFHKYMAKRLEEGISLDEAEIIKGEIYFTKAWNIYYKLRSQYTIYWWE